MTNTETYLNHPTFGLLFRVCLVGHERELFTTLYAQRLFFIVANTPNGLAFEPISRGDARLMVENRLRNLRRMGHNEEFDKLQEVHQQAF